MIKQLPLLWFACNAYPRQTCNVFQDITMVPKSATLGQMPSSQQCDLQVHDICFGGSTLEHTIPACTTNLLSCVVIVSFQ